MAQGITGTVLVSQPSEVGLFNGRLDYATTTTAKLNPNKGMYVEVDGYMIDIVASLTLTTTDNRIDSAGANAAAAMGASTSYYVYISNTVASYAPLSLRASTTAPSLLDGVNYLGTTGNARNWRFVGWIRTDGSTLFADSDTQKYVVSYYNKKKATLFSCPAYSNGGTVTTYTATATTWAQANAGTGAKIELIGNGIDAAIYSAFASASNSTLSSGNGIGIGVESTSGPLVESYKDSPVANSVGNLACKYSEVVAAGTLRSIYLLIRQHVGATCTFEADGSRNGASADPYRTYIQAEVMI